MCDSSRGDPVQLTGCKTNPGTNKLTNSGCSGGARSRVRLPGAGPEGAEEAAWEDVQQEDRQGLHRRHDGQGAGQHLPHPEGTQGQQEGG